MSDSSDHQNQTSKPWEHAKAGGSEGDPLAARFVESLSYDRRLYKHDIAGSIAHARMLCKVNLITDDDLQQIETGLKEIEAEIEANFDGWPGWKIELEDVHMCIEAALIEKVGDAGRKLHTGRSRNDQVALDLKLWFESAADHVDGLIDALIKAYHTLAKSHGEIVMPSYTHLQRAQPIVLGGECIAWAEAFRRAALRLSLIDDNFEDHPLGSGAIAGSSLPLDRKQITRALKYFGDPTVFGGIPDGDQSSSSIEATASRDIAIDFVYALSMTAMWLSRWAEQWIIYATTEFGFITIDDKYTTGSSMMPQKQNPDMLELIRGRCGNVYGHLMALLTMCKGITIGYNRDLQEDKRHVFAAYDTVCDCLEMATRIVSTVTFNEDRIKQGLDRGYLDATSLAEYLVTRGVPFRTAHQIVGATVRACGEKGFYKLEQLSVEDFNATCDEAMGGAKPQAAGEWVGEDVYEWLGPENVVKRYQTYGNAGLTGFEEQLKAWEERLGEQE